MGDKMGNDYACMIVHSTNKEFADFVSCSHIADSLPLNSFYNCRLFAVGSLHEWNERASNGYLVNFKNQFATLKRKIFLLLS